MEASTTERVLVLGVGASAVRRALGPVAWTVLEELLECSQATGGEAGPTRSSASSVRDLAGRLGLDKDTVARSIQRLLGAGVVSRVQTRATSGAFARATYLIEVPEGLYVVDRSPAPRDRRRASAVVSQLSFEEL